MKNEKMKMIRNILLFLCLIFITFFFIFKDQDFNSLFNIIMHSNKKYIFIGIISMFLYYVSESLNIKYILKKYGNKVSLIKSLKYTFIGNFFSAITPAASGGQPMEIYYMSKDGIPAAHGTIALLIELCCFHLSTLTFGILSILIHPEILEHGLIWLLIVGVALKTFVLTIFLVFVFSPKVTNNIVKIVGWILRVFGFKDVGVKQNKLSEALKKYEESADFINKNKMIFLNSIITVFVQVISLHLVSYFVYRSLGFNSLSLFQVFAIQSVLYDMVSGIPLPGAVGISEVTYLSIYSMMYPQEYVNSAMLLTRGINFYFFVVVSLIVVVINHIIMSKKNLKNS